MNRSTSIILFLLASLILVSCGGKVNEAKDAINNFKNISEAAETMAEEMKDANEEYEERRERGDTVAMHYEELAKYLPESVDDYEKSGDLDGGTTSMPGAGSFSNVSQVYKNENGDRLKISILDYNSAQMLFMTAMAAYASGFSVDTPKNMIKGLVISDDVKGWQELQKDRKESKSVVGITNRFYVEVEADNQQNTDFTNSVIENDININELARL